MSWVLVFWIFLGNGGGPAVAEFSSQETCEHAGRNIFAQSTSAGYDNKIFGNYVCVHK